mmetsp:Transcript_23141/g.87582  ORF Transcript_23141/g.87582 Transcript_23141/m.87582 type:complete len:235 (+) Transcript_23141:500-1204(+)
MARAALRRRRTFWRLQGTMMTLARANTAPLSIMSAAQSEHWAMRARALAAWEWHVDPACARTRALMSLRPTSRRRRDARQMPLPDPANCLSPAMIAATTRVAPSSRTSSLDEPSMLAITSKLVCSKSASSSSDTLAPAPDSVAALPVCLERGTAPESLPRRVPVGVSARGSGAGSAGHSGSLAQAAFTAALTAGSTGTMGATRESLQLGAMVMLLASAAEAKDSEKRRNASWNE